LAVIGVRPPAIGFGLAQQVRLGEAGELAEMAPRFRGGSVLVRNDAQRIGPELIERRTATAQLREREGPKAEKEVAARERVPALSMAVEPSAPGDEKPEVAVEPIVDSFQGKTLAM
jgi:hypothetical protein